MLQCGLSKTAGPGRGKWKLKCPHSCLGGYPRPRRVTSVYGLIRRRKSWMTPPGINFKRCQAMIPGTGRKWKRGWEPAQECEVEKMWQLCVSDLAVSQCPHISDPKLTRQTLLWPRLSFGPSWMNGNGNLWLGKPYNEEAILVAQLRLILAETLQPGYRSQEGKERGRHCSSNMMNDGRHFGSESREGREEGDSGDLEWTLKPHWITNYIGKHNT